MSLAISGAALAVAIVTLWLTHLRRPSPTMETPPKVWAGIVKPDEVILLLPLAFENAGPRPGIIRDLRVVFLDEEAAPLEFVRTRDQIRPDQSQPRFAEPFVVAGQSAQIHYCEFQRRPGRKPEAGQWTMRLEAQTSGRNSDWRPLLTFDFGISDESAKNLNAFIAHDNPAERTFDAGLEP